MPDETSIAEAWRKAKGAAPRGPSLAEVWRRQEPIEDRLDREYDAAQAASQSDTEAIRARVAKTRRETFSASTTSPVSGLEQRSAMERQTANTGLVPYGDPEEFAKAKEAEYRATHPGATEADVAPFRKWAERTKTLNETRLAGRANADLTGYENLSGGWKALAVASSAVMAGADALTAGGASAAIDAGIVEGSEGRKTTREIADVRAGAKKAAPVISGALDAAASVAGTIASPVMRAGTAAARAMGAGRVAAGGAGFGVHAGVSQGMREATGLDAGAEGDPFSRILLATADGAVKGAAIAKVTPWLTRAGEALAGRMFPGTGKVAADLRVRLAAAIEQAGQNVVMEAVPQIDASGMRMSDGEGLGIQIAIGAIFGAGTKQRFSDVFRRELGKAGLTPDQADALAPAMAEALDATKDTPADPEMLARAAAAEPAPAPSADPVAAEAVLKDALEKGLVKPEEVVSPERLETARQTAYEAAKAGATAAEQGVAVREALDALPPQQRPDGTVAAPVMPTREALESGAIEPAARPLVEQVLREGGDTVSSGTGADGRPFAVGVDARGETIVVRGEPAAAEPMVRLYRGESGKPESPGGRFLRELVEKGGESTRGRWFTTSAKEAENFAGDEGRMLFVDVPRSVAEKAAEDARGAGGGAVGEHLMPAEWVARALPVSGVVPRGTSPVEARRPAGEAKPGKSLVEFVRQQKGIDYQRETETGGMTGELDRLRKKGSGTTGLVSMSGKGLSIERMMQSAQESGYDVGHMTPGEFLDAIEMEATGRSEPSYSPETTDYEAMAEADFRRRAEEEAERYAMQTEAERLSTQAEESAATDFDPATWYRETRPESEPPGLRMGAGLGGATPEMLAKAASVPHDVADAVLRVANKGVTKAIRAGAGVVAKAVQRGIEWSPKIGALKDRIAASTAGVREWWFDRKQQWAATADAHRRLIRDAGVAAMEHRDAIRVLTTNEAGKTLPKEARDIGHRYLYGDADRAEVVKAGGERYAKAMDEIRTRVASNNDTLHEIGAIGDDSYAFYKGAVEGYLRRDYAGTDEAVRFVATTGGKKIPRNFLKRDYPAVTWKEDGRLRVQKFDPKQMKPTVYWTDPRGASDSGTVTRPRMKAEFDTVEQAETHISHLRTQAEGALPADARDVVLAKPDAEGARIAAKEFEKAKRLERTADVEYGKAAGKEGSYGPKPRVQDLAYHEPLSAQERAEMGEVTDPAIILTRTLAIQDHAISMHKFLKAYADAPALSMDPVENGKPPKGWSAMPTDKRYGALSGKWVRDGIRSEVVGLYGEKDNSLPMRMGRATMEVLDEALVAWKQGKTVDNPATHARNWIGNTIVSEMAPNPASIFRPTDWRYFRDAHRVFRANSDRPELFALAKALQRGGVGQHQGGQLNDLESIDRAVKALSGDDGSPGSGMKKLRKFLSVEMTQESAGKALSLQFQQLLPGLRSAHDAMRVAYEYQDAVFRTAYALKQMESGKSVEDAAAMTRKYFPNPNESGYALAMQKMPKVFRSGLRQTVAPPFFGYTAEMVRIMATHAVERPVTMGLMTAAIQGMTSAAAHALGMTDEDVKKLQENAPGYKPIGGMVPILPWRDADGRPQAIDLRYIFPLGNEISGIGWDGNYKIGLWNAPFARLVSDVGNNKSSLTERPIAVTDPHDKGYVPEGERFAPYAKYAWNSLASSMFGSSGERLKRGLTGEPERTGEVAGPVKAIADTIFGLRTRQIRAGEERSSRLRTLKSRYDALYARARDAKKEGDTATFEAIRAELRSVADEIKSVGRPSEAAGPIR